jgi:D-glycero-D-manno-heptose 1,7-bisphosphate phosphatase
MTQMNIIGHPAIFFDRDGVLNIDRGYVYKQADFTWVKGAKEALKLVASKGFLSIVVTNQSGIARGYYSLSDMHDLHEWMRGEASQSGGRIDDFYFCPFHDEGEVSEYVVSDHPDRKPNPGMILRAAADHNIDLSRSLLIGDKQTDIEAARRAGVQSILFKDGDLLHTLSDWFKRQGCSR